MEQQFSLNEWYKKPLGQYILMRERLELERSLALFSGSIGLEIGSTNQISSLETKFLHKIRITGFPSTDNSSSSLVCSSYTKLPFRNESIDLVLLPHTLETEELEAKAILAEAWRVLLPQGHLAILNFNPWSLWGLFQSLPSKRQFLPRCNHLYSMQKIRGWLSNQETEITLARSFCYYLPADEKINFNKEPILEKIGPLLLPYAGNVYLIIAKKQSIPVTPLRNTWSLEKVFVDKGVGTPSVGRVRRG